jgi:hypothetical protein
LVKHYLTEEAIASSQNSGSSISVVFSDDSTEDKDPDYIDIKDFLEVKVDGSVRVVPTFKTADKMKEWEEVLHHHERRALDMIHRISQLPENKHFKHYLTDNSIIYEIDEILKAEGHTVLRLPPYNPIELGWADCKNYYNKHIPSRLDSTGRVKEEEARGSSAVYKGKVAKFH